MALRAFAFRRALGELAAMRIRLVAVHALRKGHGFLEIAGHMASRTSDRGVPPEKRILCLGMIKREAWQDSFPTGGRMAVLARLLELTAMGIDVARRTGSELHVLVARLAARHVWLVTFLARHLNMEPCERIPRLRVVELIGRFPVAGVVAPGAIFPELSFVHVLVTTDAFLRKPHERFRQILILD